MKTSFKNFKGRLSQAGSMMIEAMAMLALISLVTPTLYRKSAERTSELQDINTATHVRTVLKALDNYVKTNYQELVKDIPDTNVKEITPEDFTNEGLPYRAFFPYGYDFSDLKNYEKPRAAIKRQGNSLTVFVEFPSIVDLGEMRAARIASMIGSNGGYVAGSGSNQEVKGVGGIWGLTNGELGELRMNGAKPSSIVAASSDAINSATSGALENEKYLQRTKVESEDQLWRNTMTTNLYMGGVTGADEFYKILGVDQMIIGSTDYSTHGQDLVIDGAADDGGSAWLAGNFSALSDIFTLSGNETGAEMFFGNDTDTTVLAHTDTGISFNNEDVRFLKTADPDSDANAIFAVNTLVEKELDVQGNTRVATDEGTSFKAGQDGSYITADASSVNLLGGNIVTTKTSSEESTTKKTVIDTNTDISGVVKIGELGSNLTSGKTIPDFNPILNVQGDAYIHDTLEAGKIYTDEFNVLNLHAGAEDYNQPYWLNADKDGVVIRDPATDLLRFSASEGNTLLYGPEDSQGDQASLQIGPTETVLSGIEELAMETQALDGRMWLQDGAMLLAGRPRGDGDNTIMINATATAVQQGVFQVDNESTEIPSASITDSSSLYVNPQNSGLVQMNASVTRVAPRRGGEGEEAGYFEVAQQGIGNSQGISLFAVDPYNTNRSADFTNTSAHLDPISFTLSDAEVPSSKNILYVDLRYKENADETKSEYSTTSLARQPSIYIRRGAIELEASEGSGGTGEAGHSAAEGHGYVEASRFVANNLPHSNETGTTVAQPIFSEEYSRNGSGSSSAYYQDRPIFYDRYMVNPAYTSVMHDIKLTTRGGARLSDILPDFINKGIYVVNNSYKETKDTRKLDHIDIRIIDGKLVINGGLEEGNTKNDFASAQLGVVPAPQCPPGYARVITITPAGFQMAMAGQLLVQNNKDLGTILTVDDTAGLNLLGQTNVGDDQATATGGQYYELSGVEGLNVKYVLGYEKDPITKYQDGESFKPQPLYFQQSTWLKSEVKPYTEGDNKGPCNQTPGSDMSCGAGFVGWGAKMGFLYPGSLYKNIITKILGEDAREDISYWNVFPVRLNSLEAYATVYCYFDRTEIFSNHVDSYMVDQYDQLKNFRLGYQKANDNYTGRLDDPTLQYKDPW